MTLHVHGIGHFNPSNEISNRFLEELDIGTSDSWILERVGIRTRRTVLPLSYIRETRNRDPREAREAAELTNAQTGKYAAELAIARAGIHRSDIGMLIAGSCVIEHGGTPAEACTIANELGLDVPAFDVNSACTSFHVALHLLSMMSPSALPRFVLLVVTENVTRAIDYRDRDSAVLWGDGSAAAVVSTREPGIAQVLGSCMKSNASGHALVTIPWQGHFRQSGRTVQTFAIQKSSQLLRNLQQQYATPSRTFHFVGHQANLRMLENVRRRCEIPDELHHSNVERLGNTGAAGSASVLSERWLDWTSADDVAVVGVGAGLTWSGYLLRFGATT